MSCEPVKEIPTFELVRELRKRDVLRTLQVDQLVDEQMIQYAFDPEARTNVVKDGMFHAALREMQRTFEEIGRMEDTDDGGRKGFRLSFTFLMNGDY